MSEWSNRVRRLVTALGIALLAGCTHFTPHFSTMNYDPSTMEIVGPASSRVTHYYVFGLGPGGGAKTFGIEAYDAAIKSVGADALINVVADEAFQMDFFYLFCRRTVTVRGLAVRFKK